MIVSVGIIRGLGVQDKAVKCQIFLFYFVSIPLQALLLFKFDYGVLSFPIGTVTALMILAAYYYYLIFFSVDWQIQAQLAYKRASSDDDKLHTHHMVLSRPGSGLTEKLL